MNEIIPVNNSNFWVPKQGDTFTQFYNYCENVEGLEQKDIDIIKANAKKILERCINPNIPKKNNARTNLHIGDVQSGKTLTMTAAIALAHDNGFLLTTVLTGTKTILKDQNESRIESILQKIDQDKDKFYFNKGDQSQLETQVEKLKRKPKSGVPNKMIVSIILKEKNNIEELIEKFEKLQINQKTFGSIILDDEADQASLNTMLRSEGQKSPTYSYINSLIKTHSTFTTFVQVTATASALFCIPADDPLSPLYVSLSERSEKYIGLHTYFGDEEKIKFFVRDICEDDIPEAGDNNNKPPDALINALNYFIVAVCIAKFYKLKTPYTFLCHPDSSKLEHKRYRNWIQEHFDNLNELLYKDESKLITEIGFKDVIEEISDNTGFPKLIEWSDIQNQLIKVIENSPIISIINDSHKINDLKTFWAQTNVHVIVGAMSIERGFTVEGLMVTYLSRSPGRNADNIQQRARFCGYKDPKDPDKRLLKLCRLWLDNENLDFFKSSIVTENSIRHGLEPHINDEKPYLKSGFGMIVKRPFRPTRTNIHDVLNTDGIFGWFYPRSSQYLTLEEREKNKYLCNEILKKFNFQSQAHKQWRCTSTNSLTIGDLKKLLREYTFHDDDKNHANMLTSALRNNLTQFEDDQEILTCLRVPLLKNTKTLNLNGYSDDPYNAGIKFPKDPKTGERLKIYSLPRINNMDRGYYPPKNKGPMEWIDDRKMINDKGITLHLNLVRFSLKNVRDYDHSIEADRKLKSYFEKSHSPTFIIHIKFPDLKNWRFFSQ